MSELGDTQTTRNLKIGAHQLRQDRVPGPKNNIEYSPGNIVINPSNETLEASQGIDLNGVGSHRTPMATDRRGFGQISYYSSLEKNNNLTRGQSRRDSEVQPIFTKTRSHNNAHQKYQQKDNLSQYESEYSNPDTIITQKSRYQNTGSNVRKVKRSGSTAHKIGSLKFDSQPSLTAEIRASHYKQAKKYMQAPSMKYQHDLKSYKTMKSHRSQNRTQINPTFKKFENSTKVAANLPSMLAKPSTGTPISSLKAFDTKSTARDEQLYTTRGIAESLSTNHNRWIKSSSRPQSKLGKSPESRLSPHGGKGAKLSRKHQEYKKNIDQKENNTRIRQIPISENNRPSMTKRTKQPSITRVNSHMENVPIFRLELNLDTNETSAEKPAKKAVERSGLGNMHTYQGQNPRHSLRPIAQKQIDSDEDMESEKNFSPTTSEDDHVRSGQSQKHGKTMPVESPMRDDDRSDTKIENNFDEFFEQNMHRMDERNNINEIVEINEGQLQSDTKYSEEVMVIEMNSNSSMVESSSMIPGEYEQTMESYQSDMVKAKEKYKQNAERVQQLRSQIILDSDEDDLFQKEQTYSIPPDLNNTSDFPQISEFTPNIPESKSVAVESQESKDPSGEFTNEDLLERTRVIRSKLQAFMSKRDGSENVQEAKSASLKSRGSVKPQILQRQIDLDIDDGDIRQSEDDILNYYGSKKPSLQSSSPRDSNLVKQRPSYPIQSYSPTKQSPGKNEPQNFVINQSPKRFSEKLQESPCFNQIEIGEDEDKSDEPMDMDDGVEVQQAYGRQSQVKKESSGRKLNQKPFHSQGIKNSFQSNKPRVSKLKSDEQPPLKLVISNPDQSEVDKLSKSPQAMHIIRTSFGQKHDKPYDQQYSAQLDNPNQLSKELTIPNLHQPIEHRITFTEDEHQCKTASPPSKTRNDRPVEEESIEIRQLNLEVTYDNQEKPQIVNSHHHTKRTPKTLEQQDRKKNPKSRKQHKFGSNDGQKKENMEPELSSSSEHNYSNQGKAESKESKGSPGKRILNRNQSVSGTMEKEIHHTFDISKNEDYLATDIDIDKNPIDTASQMQKGSKHSTDSKTTGDYGMLKKEYDILKKKLEQLEINKVKKTKRNTGESLYQSPSQASPKMQKKHTIELEQSKQLTPTISQTPEPINTRNNDNLAKASGHAESLSHLTENTQESSKVSLNSQGSYTNNQTYQNNNPMNPLHFSQIAQLQHQANYAMNSQTPPPYGPFMNGQIGYNQAQSMDLGMMGQQPYFDPSMGQQQMLNNMQSNSQNFFLGQPTGMQNQLGQFGPQMPMNNTGGNIRNQFSGMINDNNQMNYQMNEYSLQQIQLQQLQRMNLINKELELQQQNLQNIQKQQKQTNWNSQSNVHNSQMVPNSNYFGQRQASEGQQQLQNSQQFNTNPKVISQTGPSSQQAQSRGRSLKPDRDQNKETKLLQQKSPEQQQTYSQQKKDHNNFDFSFKNPSSRPNIHRDSGKHPIHSVLCYLDFKNIREVSSSPMQAQSRSRSQTRSPIPSNFTKPESEKTEPKIPIQDSHSEKETSSQKGLSESNSQTQSSMQKSVQNSDGVPSSGQKSWAMNFMDDIPVKQSNLKQNEVSKKVSGKRVDNFRTRDPLSSVKPLVSEPPSESDDINVSVVAPPKTPKSRMQNREQNMDNSSRRQVESKSALRLEFDSGTKNDDVNGKAKKMADKLAKRRAKSKPPKKEKTQKELYEIRKAMMKKRCKDPPTHSEYQNISVQKESNRKVQFDVSVDQPNEKMARRASMEVIKDPDVLERLMSGKRPKISKKEMKNRSSKHYKRLPEVIKKKENQNHRDVIKQRKEHAKLLDKIAREQMKRKTSRRKSEAPEDMF